MITNAKKQNRILTAALIIIIAAIVALIALTSGANRRAKPPADDLPPVGQRADKTDESSTPAKRPEGENVSPGEDSPEDAPAAKVPADNPEKAPDQELDEKLTPGTAEKTSAEPDDAVPASAAADGIPPLRAPLENAVAVKGCSLSVPVFSDTMEDYRVHRGIDFACAPGTPVLAAADGVISSVAKDPMMGWTVTLSHDGGAETRYAGLSEESANIAKTGDRVLSGQVIGASGETALIESAEENHLHFELAVNGRAEDPADYMDVVWLSETFED